MVNSLLNISQEIRDFANDLDADLNFIKDATLDAATEVEAVTQYVLEAAA